jgi:hypothetical protein
MSPGTPSPSGQMRTAPGPSTVGVLKIALPFESQQKGTSSGVLPFWSSFPPIYYPSSYRITAQGVESSIVGQIGIRRIDATDEKQSADEWTRTARLPITGDKQGVAGTAGFAGPPYLSRFLSSALPRVAPYFARGGAKEVSAFYPHDARRSLSSPGRTRPVRGTAGPRFGSVIQALSPTERPASITRAQTKPGTPGPIHRAFIRDSLPAAIVAFASVMRPGGPGCCA